MAALPGPAGLYIGSRTPGEIAVSIAAELVAVKNGVTRTGVAGGQKPRPRWRSRRTPSAPPRHLMAAQGILLAAGYGRRFDPEAGQAAGPMADGRPVLWHSARALAQALPQCLAVIRPGQRERARWLAEAGCRCWRALPPRRHGCALAAAVAANEDATGWVVALGDMPWLETAAIEAAASLESPCALLLRATRASAAIRWVSVAAGAGLDGAGR